MKRKIHKENDRLQTVKVSYRRGNEEGHIVQKYSYDERARFAVEFIERLGMIAGMPDGEDSAGRSQLRIATPQEMVDRAISCAELLNNAIHAKGWAVETPPLSEVNDEEED